MIKHVFFDLYQTLIDVDINDHFAWEVFEDYSIKKGVAKDKAKQFKTLFDKKETVFYSHHDKMIHHHDWIDNIKDIFQNNYNLSYSPRRTTKIIV